MRHWLLSWMICIAACNSPAPTEQPKPVEEYSPPVWRLDPDVAAVSSMLSETNRPLLKEIMFTIADRELSLLNEEIKRIDDYVQANQSHLRRAIEDPGETLDEELFAEYCSRLLIQIEILKIKKAHKEDLLKLSTSLRKLRDSLNGE